MVEIDTVIALMAQMRADGIAELLWEKSGERLHLVSDGAVPRAAPTPAADAPMPETPAGGPEIVAAPMHGLFFLAPAPDAPPFVQPGQRVAAGDPLCILEVMKTLTRIHADHDCIVREVLCANAREVEPGTPLFAVDRA